MDLFRDSETIIGVDEQIFFRMKVNKQVLILIILIIPSILMSNSFGYSDAAGVELGDIVDVSFTSYIDGEYNNQYTESNPFRVLVDPGQVNVNFMNAIIGMKVGETKASITWYVNGTDGPVFVEYKGTTIVYVIPRIELNNNATLTISYGSLAITLLTILSLAVLIPIIRKKE